MVSSVLTQTFLLQLALLLQLILPSTQAQKWKILKGKSITISYMQGVLEAESHVELCKLAD